MENTLKSSKNNSLTTRISNHTASQIQVSSHLQSLNISHGIVHRSEHALIQPSTNYWSQGSVTDTKKQPRATFLNKEVKERLKEWEEFVGPDLRCEEDASTRYLETNFRKLLQKVESLFCPGKKVAVARQEITQMFQKEFLEYKKKILTDTRQDASLMSDSEARRIIGCVEEKYSKFSQEIEERISVHKGTDWINAKVAKSLFLDIKSKFQNHLEEAKNDIRTCYENERIRLKNEYSEPDNTGSPELRLPIAPNLVDNDLPWYAKWLLLLGKVLEAKSAVVSSFNPESTQEIAARGPLNVEFHRQHKSDMIRRFGVEDPERFLKKYNIVDITDFIQGLKEYDNKTSKEQEKFRKNHHLDKYLNDFEEDANIFANYYNVISNEHEEWYNRPKNENSHVPLASSDPSEAEKRYQAALEDEKLAAAQYIEALETAKEANGEARVGRLRADNIPVGDFQKEAVEKEATRLERLAAQEQADLSFFNKKAVQAAQDAATAEKEYLKHFPPKMQFFNPNGGTSSAEQPQTNTAQDPEAHRSRDLPAGESAAELMGTVIGWVKGTAEGAMAGISDAYEAVQGIFKATEPIASPNPEQNSDGVTIEVEGGWEDRFSGWQEIASPSKPPVMQPDASSPRVEQSKEIQQPFALGGAAAAPLRNVLENQEAVGFYADARSRVKRAINWMQPSSFIQLAAQGGLADFREDLIRGDSQYDTTFFHNLVDPNFASGEATKKALDASIKKLREQFTKDLISQIKTDGNQPLFSRMPASFLDWLIMDENRLQAIKAEHIKNILPETFSTLSRSSLESLLESKALARTITISQANAIDSNMFDDANFLRHFLSHVESKVFADLFINKIHYFKLAFNELKLTNRSDMEVLFDKILTLTHNDIAKTRDNIANIPISILEYPTIAKHILSNMSNDQIGLLLDTHIKAIPPSVFSDLPDLITKLTSPQKTHLTVPHLQYVSEASILNLINEDQQFLKNVSPEVAAAVCARLSETEFQTNSNVKSYVASLYNRSSHFFDWMKALPDTHILHIGSVSDKYANEYLLNHGKAYEKLKLLIDKHPSRVPTFFRSMPQSLFLSLVAKIQINRNIIFNSKIIKKLDINFFNSIANRPFTPHDIINLTHFINIIFSNENIKSLSSDVISRLSGDEFMPIWRAIAHFTMFHMEVSQIQAIPENIVVKLAEIGFLSNNSQTVRQFIQSLSSDQRAAIMRSESAENRLINNIDIIRASTRTSNAEPSRRATIFVAENIRKMTSRSTTTHTSEDNMSGFSLADIIKSLIKSPDKSEFYLITGTTEQNTKVYKLDEQVHIKMRSFASEVSNNINNYVKAENYWNKLDMSAWVQITEDQFPKGDYGRISISGHGSSSSVGGHSYESLANEYKRLTKGITRVNKLLISACATTDRLGTVLYTTLNDGIAHGQKCPQSPEIIKGSKVIISQNVNPGNIAFNLVMYLQTGQNVLDNDRSPLIKWYENGVYRQSKGHDNLWTVTRLDGGELKMGSYYSDGRIRREGGRNYKESDEIKSSLVVDTAAALLLQDAKKDQVLAQLGQSGLEAHEAAQVRQGIYEAEQNMKRLSTSTEEVSTAAKRKSSSSLSKKPDKSDLILIVDQLKSGSPEALLINIDTKQTETVILDGEVQSKINDVATEIARQKQVLQLAGQGLDVASDGSFVAKGTSKISARFNKFTSMGMGTAFVLLQWQAFLSDPKNISKLPIELQISTYYNLLDGATGVTQDAVSIAKNLLVKFGPQSATQITGILKSAGRVLGKANVALSIGSLPFDVAKLVTAKDEKTKVEAISAIVSTLATLGAGAIGGGGLALPVALLSIAIDQIVALKYEAREFTEKTIDELMELEALLKRGGYEVKDGMMIFAGPAKKIDFSEKTITFHPGEIKFSPTAIDHAQGARGVNISADGIATMPFEYAATQSIWVDQLANVRVLPYASGGPFAWGIPINQIGGGQELSPGQLKFINRMISQGILTRDVFSNNSNKAIRVGFSPPMKFATSNNDPLESMLDAQFATYPLPKSQDVLQTFAFNAHKNGGGALITNTGKNKNLILRDDSNAILPSSFIVSYPEVGFMSSDSLTLQARGDNIKLIAKNTDGTTSEIDVSAIKHSSVKIVGNGVTWEWDPGKQKLVLTEAVSLGKYTKEELKDRLISLSGERRIAPKAPITFSNTPAPTPPAIPEPQTETKFEQFGIRGVRRTTTVTTLETQTIEIEEAVPGDPNKAIKKSTASTPKTHPMVREFEARNAQYAADYKQWNENTIYTYFDENSQQVVGLDKLQPGTKLVPGTDFFFNSKTGTVQQILNTNHEIAKFYLLIPHQEGTISDFTTEGDHFSFKHQIPNGEKGKTAAFSYTWKNPKLSLTKVGGLTSAQLNQLMPPTLEEAQQKLGDYARQNIGILSGGAEHTVSVLFRGHHISGTIKIHHGNRGIETKVRAVTDFSERLKGLFPHSTPKEASVQTPTWMKFEGSNERGEPQTHFINSKTGKVISSGEGNLKATDEFVAEVKPSKGGSGGFLFHSPQEKTMLFVRAAADGTLTFNPRMGKIVKVSPTQDSHSVYLIPEDGREIRQWDPFDSRMIETIPVKPVQSPTSSIDEYDLPLNAAVLNYNLDFSPSGASWKSAKKYGDQVTMIQKVPYGRASLDLIYKTYKSEGGKNEALLDEISGLTEEQLNRLSSKCRAEHRQASSSMNCVAKFLAELTGVNPAQIKTAKWLKITDPYGQQQLLNTHSGYAIRPLKGDALDIEGGGRVHPRGDYQWVESGQDATGTRSWHYAWSPTTKLLKLVRRDEYDEHHYPRTRIQRTRNRKPDHFTHLLRSTSFIPVQETDGSYRYVTEDGKGIYLVDPKDGHLKLQSKQELVNQEDEDSLPHFHPAMEGGLSPTEARNSSATTVNPILPTHGMRHHHNRHQSHRALNN